MATITGLTAARMIEIESQSIVDGEIVGDNLILTRFDNDTIDAGNVRGPQGDKGDTGAQGPIGPAGLNWQGVWSETTNYVNDDAVFYQTSSWFAFGDPPVGEIPSDASAYWNPLALQGAVGPQGAKGDTGEQGPQGIQGPLGGGTPAGGIAGQIMVKTSSTDYDIHWEDNSVPRVKHLVKNSTGAIVPAGSVVYISGADGTNMLISLADADTEATSSKTIGLVETAIAIGASGYVVTEGLLAGLNTNTATAGQSVWLSSTAGGFVYGAPPAKPAHSVYLGVVTRANTNNGEIFVKVQNGYEVDELHDVAFTNLVAGDILQRNTGNTAFVNAPAPLPKINAAVTLADASSSVVRNIKLSTVAPTSGDGSDGEVWMVYV